MTSTTMSLTPGGVTSLMSDDPLTRQSTLATAVTEGTIEGVLTVDANEEEEETNTAPVLTTDNDAGLRVGNYSPATDLTFPSNRPDLSMFCGDCQCFIALRALNEHRTYHRSLQLLLYKENSRPHSVEALLKRRKAILRRLKSKTTSDSPLDPQQLQKLNDAFEFLKADLEETYEAYRMVRENPQTEVQGIGLNCSSDCALAVGICAHGNERWKNSMEDTRVFQDCFGNDTHKCFFGIYDGHHGRFAAEVSANKLHHALLLEMARFDPRTKCTCAHNMADEYDLAEYDIHSRAPTAASDSGLMFEESTTLIQKIIADCENNLQEMEPETKPNSVKRDQSKKKKKKDKDPFAEKMAEAVTKAHKYTDVLLSYGKDEQSRVRWSGCSTLACVVQDTLGSNGPVVGHQPTNNSMPRKNSSEEKGGLSGDKAQFEAPKDLGTIHLGNAGNVHAILVRANRVYRLTKDHTPYNSKEQTRVKKLGASINESERELRVNGVLATTRGLGNHGDLEMKRCVAIEPSTTDVKVDQYAQFLVLASNGLWEVFSHEEVAALLLQMLPANYLPPPSRVSTSIRNLMISRQSEAQSDVPTDAHAANRMLRNKSASSTATAVTSPGGNLRKEKRPLTGQSQKSKASLSVRIMEETIGEDGKQKVFGCHDKMARNRKEQDQLSINADMQTEVGSRIEADFNDEDYESGNEADIDTVTDGITLCQSGLSGHIPTREEMQREFAKRMSERLTQAALLAGAKDNITVMVVLLPGCGL